MTNSNLIRMNCVFKLFIVLAIFVIQTVNSQETTTHLKELSKELVFKNSSSVELKESAFQAIDRLVSLLKAEPSVKISVESHSCIRGKHNALLEKTKQRAQLIKNELIKRGITSNRINAIGYGRSQASCYRTRAGDINNERIIIKVQANN